MALSRIPANQNLLGQTGRLGVQDACLKLSVIRPGLYQGLDFQLYPTDFIDVSDRDGLSQPALYMPNAVAGSQAGKDQNISKRKTLRQQDAHNHSTQPRPNRQGQIRRLQEMGECGCGHKSG